MSRPISTGKWGCGAFSGDPQLKFLQQWMAVSVLGRQMVFNTFQDNNKLEDLAEITTKYLNGKTVGDLFRYIEGFGRGQSEHSLFKYISMEVVRDEEEAERKTRAM